MSVAIRLTRRGTKRNPIYRLVAAAKEKSRDGRFLETLATYDPRKDQILNFKKERVEYWISKGAKPSLRAAKVISDANAS